MESAAETCRRTDERAVELTNGPIAVDQHEAGPTRLMAMVAGSFK